MMPDKKQIAVLRELAKQLSEIAHLPEMAEKKAGWIALNDMKPIRPMVIMDQFCWEELNIDGSLTCVCDDPFWKRFETGMRHSIMKHKYFPADFVVEDFLRIEKVVNGYTGMGVCINEDTAALGEADVKGHYYHDQLETDEAVDALQPAEITYDKQTTEQRLAEAKEIFAGIMPVKLAGITTANNIWDALSMYRGVENPLYDMIERPEFIHKIMEKFTSGYLKQLDQIEAMNLLDGEQQYIHCTGAFTDQLPKPDAEPGKVRACDTWTYGLAQMLSTVSPAMFDEFEVQYVKRWAARFGLVYYGCCDPLDRKMEQVRKIPNVRKVSMSPWTDPDIGAAGIAGDFVFSSKPSPAMLAGVSFEPEAVEANLRKIKHAAQSNGCPVEFILKDISTVKNDFSRLVEWEKIAMKVAKD